MQFTNTYILLKKGMRILLFLSSIIISTTCAAQEVVTLQTDSGEMQITYFQREAGKKPVISTYYLWTKANKHRGVAVALNRAGKQLFRAEVGVVHGVQHVDFRYYANGAVERIHHTAQPDGGIQRHDITRFYSEAGDFIWQEDNSTDNMGQPRVMHIQSINAPDSIGTPVVPKQQLKASTHEAIFINNTKQPVKVSVKNKENRYCHLLLKIRPGESKTGPIPNENGPQNYFCIMARGLRNGRKIKPVLTLSQTIANKRIAFYWEINP